jgi:hypothetical protein
MTCNRVNLYRIVSYRAVPYSIVKLRHGNAQSQLQADRRLHCPTEHGVASYGLDSNEIDLNVKKI